MRASGDVYLQLALPAEFLELSPTSLDEKPAAVPPGENEARDARFHSALRAVSDFATSRGAVRSWALVIAPPSGAIDAVLLLRVLQRADDQSLSNYYDFVTGELGDHTIINRTTARASVAGLEAVVVRDFVLPPSDEGPARERGFVIVDSGESLIEFDIETQDMSLFDDAGVYLLDLLSAGWGGLHDE